MYVKAFFQWSPLERRVGVQGRGKVSFHVFKFYKCVHYLNIFKTSI